MFYTIDESWIIVKRVIDFSEFLLLLDFIVVLEVFNQVRIDGHDYGKVLIFLLFH